MCNNLFYYSTVLVIVQKKRMNNAHTKLFHHDIVQLVICTLGYCTVENRFD